MPLFAIPFPPISPIAFEIGPIDVGSWQLNLAIRWYALAYIVGIFFGWWWARRLAADQRLWGGGGSPITPLLIDDAVLWVTVGIIAGGRLGYVAVYDLDVYLAEPVRILQLWNGGMSFHGAFVGVALALILFAWRHKLPVWRLFDLITATVPFGLLIGRFGNFANAELYGRPTDVPWAMVFPTDPEGLPRHPSQVYEAMLEGLVLFLVLQWLIYRRQALASPGFIGGAFMAGYGIARTFCEFFRQPDEQIGFLGWGTTMGMRLSIPMILIGIAVMVWSKRRSQAAE